MSINTDKIYFHIGTEKTGSSYLQKVCALNRSWLEQSGIYFPSGGRDETLITKGTVSPGNARELAELIEAGEWDKVEDWLEKRIELSRGRSCNSLLLSHELLFACFARKGVIENLLERVRKFGVEQVSALLFVRDPVDHAISLYKHRGKSGIIGSLREWIRSRYSTAIELADLIDVFDHNLICMNARKYRKDSNYLLAAFFKDWLGIGEPPLLPEGLVNPSLTFSEIELLRKLAKTRPWDVSLFYRKLLAVSPEAKADNDSLEGSARRETGNYLADFEDTWRKLDALLEVDGGLDIPRRSLTDSAVDESFRFSELQLQAIAESHSEAQNARFKLTVFFDKYIRPPLGKLKRVLGL